MSLSQSLALYQTLNHYAFDDIPQKTLRIVKASLLDLIGIMAAASHNQTCQAIARYAEQHYPAGRFAARLFFSGRAVAPLGAAWAGGFMADSLDAHEGHFTSKGHAGATVVPALLVLMDVLHQQHQPQSGQRFLTLLTLAYETALRAGVALINSAGYYPASGAFSGLGVVCAGAPLLHLSAAEFAHALGIAEYFGPRCPMMRLIDHPSMLRDAHGAGAYTGLNALYLAQSGITGAPAESVENTALLSCWQDLGQRWEINNQYFKPWPVCRWAQPALTAIQQLRADHPHLDTTQIERIRVETFHESLRLQGYRPQNPDEAQYALAFPLAAMLVRGQLGIAEVSQESLHDPAILALCDRIELVEADDLNAAFPHHLRSRVHLELADGRCLSSATTDASGDPDKPMTALELSEKFYRFGAVNLPQSRLEALVEEIDQLEYRPDCNELLKLVFQANESS